MKIVTESNDRFLAVQRQYFALVLFNHAFRVNFTKIVVVVQLQFSSRKVLDV